MIPPRSESAGADWERLDSELPEPRPGVLIWDAPVRLFHALLVLCVAGAWLSGESERWRLLHITLGETAAGLVAFRLVWGLVGSRWARFASFVRGPRAALAHLREIAQGEVEPHSGHNPAGALAIVGLLGLVAFTAALGWFTEQEWLPAALDELHEASATLLLALIGLHLAGVALGSRMQRENLALAMLTGRKRAPAGDGLRHASRPVAAALLAAVLGFWAWQWQHAPGAAPAAQAPAPESAAQAGAAPRSSTLAAPPRAPTDAHPAG